MKRIFSVCFFLLMLGVATAQQSTNNSPAATNSVATGTIEEVKARAEKGDAIAQCNLGAYYYYGNGGATNYTEAVNWYRKSAEQNYAEAQFCLGNCYEYGEGVATNYVEAVNWFRKAAEQNYAPAQISLGGCYDDGI